MKYYDNVRERFPDYLNDESGIVKNSRAERIFFPETEQDIQNILKQANQAKTPVAISGGGTGISGGRVPLCGWIVATDKMTGLHSQAPANAEQWQWRDPETDRTYEVRLEKKDANSAVLTVPVAITIKAIQNLAREKGWFYPPDSTERSAFIGGNVVTNASGARTFKFGATRPWVTGMRVVLPQGEAVALSRSQGPYLADTPHIAIPGAPGYAVPRPSYTLPQIDKNVAGPVLTAQSEAIDLFIGSEGLFGVISEVSLHLIKPPEEIVSLFIYCRDNQQAFRLIRMCQDQRRTQTTPIPMSVEFLDSRSLGFMREKGQVPDEANALVILEQDVYSEDELFDSLEFYSDFCDDLGVIDTSVAENRAQIEKHKELRHTVPEAVNALVRKNGQSKLGTDYAVPEKSFKELFDYVFHLGDRFEAYQQSGQPGYAFWAHAGDNHIHLNLLPTTDKEAAYARELVLDLVKKVVGLNGTIAAEHGLGKKQLGGHPLLYYQYGDQGIADIRAMKEVLDPLHLLNRGNLIGQTG